MSCCGGNCNCGSTCGCGCGMYPDIETTTAAAILVGVAPPAKMYSEQSFGAEGGCKGGDNCTCDPCAC